MTTLDVGCDGGQYQKTRHIETLVYLMLVHRLRRWPNIKTALCRVCWDAAL